VESRTRVALALSLLWASACDDGLEPLRVGRFVDFTTEDPSKSLCVGTPARLDRHVEQVHKFIEEPIPNGLRVPLRVVVDESTCPSNACYSHANRTIYAEELDLEGYFPDSTVEHELTHALIHRAWGASVPSLEEGVAEALTSHEWQSPQPAAPVRSMLDQTAAEFDYVELGRFVRFLIDSDGIAQFKRLYQTTQTRSREAIEANFKAVYGEDFETIEMRYLSGPPRCRYQLDACDDSTAESVGTAWSETFAASCFDSDAYGSRSDDFERFAMQRSLRIEVEGLYRLRTSVPVLLAASGVRFSPDVLLVRCGDCDEQKVRPVVGEGVFTLVPGLYTILLDQIGDSIVTLELELIADAP